MISTRHAIVVRGFVCWYNMEHPALGAEFLTPDDRYNGRDKGILAGRHRLYQRTRKQHPHRWSGETRDWSPAPAVVLNPHQVLNSQAAA